MSVVHEFGTTPERAIVRFLDALHNICYDKEAMARAVDLFMISSVPTLGEHLENPLAKELYYSLYALHGIALIERNKEKLNEF